MNHKRIKCRLYEVNNNRLDGKDLIGGSFVGIDDPHCLERDAIVPMRDKSLILQCVPRFAPVGRSSARTITTMWPVN